LQVPFWPQNRPNRVLIGDNGVLSLVHLETAIRLRNPTSDGPHACLPAGFLHGGFHVINDWPVCSDCVSHWCGRTPRNSELRFVDGQQISIMSRARCRRPRQIEDIRCGAVSGCDGGVPGLAQCSASR
jgi:hypothetical protein